MGFRGFIEGIALDTFTKEFNKRLSLLQKSVSSNSGNATVTKVNKDGTVDVNLNGQVITGVSPGSQPIGVGSTSYLVDGKQLLGR